ncbi:DUF389 domain-containing protein [Solirubrobacter taibaiensis]|nr:DUF389 domain-containing protein [Solirubrobacter taibaiensis]
MSILTDKRVAPWLSGELRTADEVRDAVYLFAGDAPAKLSRFWLLLVLSAVIASAGVIGDSTATVIGAMIIAPLATPIQGVAVGLAGGELRALLQSMRILVTAGLAVVLIGAVAEFVLPQIVVPASNAQITGRVAPTLIDLVAAAATGLAGSLAIARRDIGDILPGVAIAISLVPPLAVVGITAADGAWDDALGALLLFTTNVLAIIVAGSLLYSLLKLLPGAEGVRRRPAYLVVAAAGTVVVLALSVATFRTVQLQQRQAAASDIATSWAERNGEQLVNTHYEGAALVVLVEGRADGSADPQLLPELADAVPRGTPVEINRLPGQRRALGTVP